MTDRPARLLEHPSSTPLLDVETALFDLDGCIWFGDTLADGARDLVHALRDRGIRVRFLTNISSATSADVAARLTELGIDCPPEHVQTPLGVLPHHPHVQGDARAFVLGKPRLKAAVAELGIRTTETPDEATVVLVTRDPEMTYDDLARATRALYAGAKLLSLNMDARVPVAHGTYVPGNGAIAALLTVASGVQADAIGKPSAFFFEQALERFGASRASTIMIGDNLDSDIAGGIAAGLRTVHVGGDAYTRADTPPLPDHRAADLRAVADLLLPRP